jgi:hypothetical protein
MSYGSCDECGYWPDHAPYCSEGKDQDAPDPWDQVDEDYAWEKEK